jgi:hypothetical protein
MVARRWNYRFIQLLILAFVLMATGWLAAPMAAAAELDKLDTSLKLIPEDAAFYSCMLRNREQFEAVRNSNAWAKVQQMPAVQMGLSFYSAQLANPDGKLAKLDSVLKNPEIRKVLDLLVDMASDEVFVYGDDSCTDCLELMQNVAGAVRYGPIVAQATGEAKAHNSNLQAMLALSALAQHADMIAVPNVVVGFKVKNTDLAKEQLIKLEMFGNLLEANEKTKGRFKKTKVGDHEYLVLELDGEMVPWEMLPTGKLKEMELEEGDAEKVVDQLKEMKLVIAIGVRDKYLLCSIGSSLDCLEKLGQGNRLIDRPEFKPLEKFADKRLTSIGYLSEEMNQQIRNQRKNLDDLRELAERLLPLAKLTDQQNERIRKDVAGWAEDVKGLIPEPGAIMGLSFLSDRGIEGYQYAWGEHGKIDGSKPLGLLQHVGGNPILGVVSRAKASAADYDLVVKWAKTAYGYFEELALPKIPEAERAKAKKFLDAALPLLARMDKTNREMLIPALADGQAALVIDGKLQSKHFIESLPATEKPMPMVEPAIVVGLSDAKLLKQAFGEYRAIVNGLIDAVRQVEGSNVPANVKIPEPQVTEGSSGTIYSFTLPKEWGVDEKIVPNVGVSNEVAVLSASREHTERLLKAAPLSIGGVLDKTDRPLAAAVWLDWAALVDAAAPWVDFAFQQAAAAKAADESRLKTTLDHVHIGLEVLKALRSITSESYLEGEALVTHTLTEMHDVGK